MGERGWCKALGSNLGESACVVKPIKARLWLWGSFLCCGAPPRGLSKAPRGSGLCCKQPMVCLEGLWFVAENSTPMHDPGRRRNSLRVTGLRLKGC